MAPCDVQRVVRAVPVASGRLMLVYSSDRVPGRTAAPVADQTALGVGGWGIDGVHQYVDGVLLAGNGERRAVEATPVGSSGDIVVANGGDLLVFDAIGRHRRTIDEQTGVVVTTVAYTSDGAIAAVTDRYGATINLRRSGAAITIVAPTGGTSTLTLTADGWLGSIDPGTAREQRFTYTTGGLMLTATSAESATTTYEYDPDGRLAKTVDPTGAVWTSTSRATASGRSLVNTDPMGRTSELDIERVDADTVKATVRGIDGTTSVATATRSGQRSLANASGDTATMRYRADTRFGWSAPVLVESTWKPLSGTATTATYDTVVTLADPGDPLSLKTRRVTATENGTTRVVTYERATRTTTTVEPNGVTSTVRFDAKGDIESTRSSENGAVTSVKRSKAGEISQVTTTAGRASRTTAITFEPDGSRVITDALGRKVRAAQRPGLGTFQLADGRTIEFRTAADGTPLSTSGPGFEQLFSSDERGLLTGNTLSVNGTRSVSVERESSGRVGAVVMPDGRRVTMAYDDAGRLASRTFSAGTTSFRYAADGSIERVDAAGGVSASLTATPSATATTWSGPISGTVGRTLDGTGAVSSLDLAGTRVPVRSKNGVVTSVGDLELVFDPKVDAIVGLHSGSVVEQRTVNGFGEVERVEVSVADSVVYDEKVQRDSAGRITRREVAGLAPSTYRYDVTDRLVESTESGSAPVTYAYDASDQRTTRTVGDSSIAYSYDTNGRLVSAGATRYTFGSDGSLASRTDASGTTSFTYDEFGVLRRAVLADGRTIDYLIDGAGRRVGKLVEGKLTAGWLYEGNRVVAQLDASGTVVARYVYGDQPAPALILRAGRTLRVVSNTSGAPRLVLDASTGEIVERIDTDPFGADRAAAGARILPIGIAGGLIDTDTGLVHLGARDYDPSLGRFTAPDPAGLHATRFNPYVYAGQNPVNRVDPSGLADDELTDEQKKQRDKVLGAIGDLFNDAGAVADLYELPGGVGADSLNALADVGKLLNATTDAEFVSATTSLLSDVGKAASGIMSAGAAIAPYKLVSATSAVSELSSSIDGYRAGTTGKAELIKNVASATYEIASLLASIAAAVPAIAAAAPALLAIAAAAASLALALTATCMLPGFDCTQDGPAPWYRRPGGRGGGDGADDGDGDDNSDTFADIEEALTAWIYGDPHLVSFDGRAFDYHGVGEFVLTALPAEHITVFARFAPVGISGATYATSAVVDMPGARVQADVDQVSRVLRVRVNGADVDPLVALPLDGGARIIPRPRGIVVRAQDGTRFDLFRRGATLSVKTSLRDTPVDVHGLLGNANGDQADDLRSSTGTIVPDDRGDALYLTFGESWRTTTESSPFLYEPGTDWTSFNRVGYVPPAVSPSSLPAEVRDRAEATCRSQRITDPIVLASCIVDVGLLDDTSLASEARSVQVDAVVRRRASPAATAVAPGSTVGPVEIPAGERRVFEIGTPDSGAAYLAPLTRCTPGPATGRWFIADKNGEAANVAARTESVCTDLGRVTKPAAGAPYVAIEAPATTSVKVGFTSVALPSTQEFTVTVPADIGPDRPGAGAGVAESLGALDAYVFDAKSGDRIRMNLSPLSAGTPGRDFQLLLVGPDGRSVMRESAADPHVADIAVSGRYRLEVGFALAGYAGAATTARYFLSVAPPSASTTGLTFDADTVADLSSPGSVATFAFDAVAGDLFSFEWRGSCPIGDDRNGFVWKVNPKGTDRAVFNSMVGTLASKGWCQSIGRVEIDKSGVYEVQLSSPSVAAGSVRFRARKIVDQTFALTLGMAVGNDRPAAGAGVLEGFGVADIFTVQLSAGSYSFSGTTCGTDQLMVIVIQDKAFGATFTSDLCSLTATPMDIARPGLYRVVVATRDLLTEPSTYGFTLNVGATPG